MPKRVPKSVKQKAGLDPLAAKAASMRNTFNNSRQSMAPAVGSPLIESRDLDARHLSLIDQMSTKKRVQRLTENYKTHILSKDGHPSYNTGYNPRHYNYMKNSGNYTNANPRNLSPEPNLMEITHEQRTRLKNYRNHKRNAPQGILKTEPTTKHILRDCDLIS